ncbi:MAG: gamma-glutamyl-gamma-aminobutyrate hydrolase family protein [Bifidobacteriaceae bacterium]|jgi:para-aminobenzoate synthetase component 2|nr:gamma-glutamyl-gamma-aminobutyrate hydrolase family protein [Bifidobacteriaceae bacterium]
MPRILVVDNYDSFVFTLADYVRRLGAEAVVFRNDAVPGASLPNSGSADDAGPHPKVRPATAATVGYDGVLVSPGPGNPRGAGASLAVIAECAARGLPMLGVCLGHQALGEAFGATVAHAPELRHGKTSAIEHNGRGVFAGLPSPLEATRYHSLAVVPATIPPELEITARAGGVVMGLTHRSLPLHGVQFHPESILTEHGEAMIANWLALTGPR